MDKRPLSGILSPGQEKEAAKKYGFTLVELIVVITILAILGTIAFISLQGYSQDARDSVRVSDMSKIKTSLELFQLDAGKYPETTDYFSVTYSGALAWTQGIFGDKTYSNVEKLDKIPTDPVTNRKYIYSVTNTRQEYEVAGVMEGDEITINTNQPHPSPLLRGEGINGILETNAAGKTSMLKISGNYNGKLLKVSTGGTDYVLAVPSIITSSGFTLEQIVAGKLLAYNGYKNLPAQYAGSSYEVLGDSGINFVNSSNFVVYSGSLITLSDSTQTGIDARKNLIENLQKAYNGTDINGIGEISQIINTQLTDTGAVELLSTTIVNNDLGGSVLASVVNNTENTPITIPGDDVLLINNDYTTISPNDDFSAPEVNTKWATSFNQGGSIGIESGKIATTVLGDGINTKYANVISKYGLKGDFDIQVDIDLVTFPIPSTGSNQAGFVVQGYNTSGGVNYFSIRRVLGPTYSRYILYWRNNGVYSSFNYDIANPLTSGKFRMTRVGNLFSGYYWNGTSWVKIGELTNGWTVDVDYIGLQPISSLSNDLIKVNYDNFIINSGNYKYLDIYDTSSTPKTIARYGNLYHSNTQKKIGESSIYFDGDGDYGLVTDNDDFTFGDKDFTIDGWMYLDGTQSSNNSRIFVQKTGESDRFDIMMNGAKLYAGIIQANVSTFGLESSINFPVNAWSHFAIIRKGNDWKMFIDGILADSGTFDLILPNYTSGVYMGGADYASRSIKGYLDAFRIRNGGARWTENFTPPTSY